MDSVSSGGLVRVLRLLLLLVWRAWERFWFAEKHFAILDVIRAAVGGALFIANAALSSRLDELYGNDGWMSLEGIRYQRAHPFINSLHHHITERIDLWALHYLFLGCLLLFAVGGFTRVVKWFVLVCHISYSYRNPASTYGTDSLSAVLLWILCLAPIGQRFSVDSWLAGRDGRALPLRSILPGSTALRLIQLQLCIMYFYAGVAKLRGSAWWEGNGVWGALTNYHFNAPLEFLAQHYWLPILLNYGTLALEISYPFLIWGRLRPLLCMSAISMHLGIGLLMNMHLFGFVSMAANLAFFNPQWIRYFRRGGLDALYYDLCQDPGRPSSTDATEIIGKGRSPEELP